ISDLSLKIKKSDKTLNYFLIQQADKLLLDLPENNSFEDLVRLEIIHSLKQGRISIEGVAKRMGYSPRMFQYQLKLKGMNFKQSLNQVRKEMAVKYLSDLNLTILEISYLLSYQEQTSFIRAFKSWTGLSPLQYRRKYINNYSDISLGE
ncbi:helix-turn-helix transcriptional regulator, partial [Acinetobacter seifertii]|uniref:helix-turn-helix domain-containing protein n=1 Tax=Acinetobacter seifertii TaxID=1530123 RepID=UPI0019009DA2